MKIRTVVVLALALTWLGCSKPEPEAPQDAAPPAPAAPQAPAPGAAPTASPKRPIVTLPTVAEPHADVPTDPRRAETPCDRHEAGWKWVGTVVEDGRCVVGPCACEKE